MTMMRSLFRTKTRRFAGLGAWAALAGLLLGTLVVPASARAPELAMLNGLQDGRWELRMRDDGSRSHVCLRSGRELIQIRHSQLTCKRFVVNDGPSEVTVQYTCPGHGYGNTTIRRETAQLVQINSQGIEGGAPFHFNAEARRVGGC